MNALSTPLVACDSLKSGDFDGIVVVSHAVDAIPFAEVSQPLKAVVEVDKKAESGVFLAPAPSLPAKRIIFSGTGKLDQDWDDVRSYADAADKGVTRAIAAGCRAPLLLFAVKDEKRFPEAGLVAVLGAMKAVYVPLEVREQVKEKASKVDKLGVFGDSKSVAEKIELARALETGRIVSRDIGGSDPERMAAPRCVTVARLLAQNENVGVVALDPGPQIPLCPPVAVQGAPRPHWIVKGGPATALLAVVLTLTRRPYCRRRGKSLHRLLDGEFDRGKARATMLLRWRQVEREGRDGQ